MFILRRSEAAIFADISKIVIMFIKKFFKDLKKVKIKLEIMYQNAPPRPPSVSNPEKTHTE